MISTRNILGIGLLALASLLGACSQSHDGHAHGPAPLPDGDGVYFITPRDGDVVTSPVAVRFGLKGRGVSPAGIEMPNTGHHHLLINATTLPPMNQPIPADEKHVHFGGGQTQSSVQLPPGQHTLQLVVGDHLHVPLGAQWISEKITITVE